MAEAGHWITARNLIPLPIPYKVETKSLKVPCSWATSQTRASLRRDEFSPITRKNNRTERRLVTISTSAQGRWKGKWTSDHLLSFQDLQLQDLVEEEEEKGQGETLVFISLSIHKHASFGLSVEGNIVTSITRKCSICSSPYCSKIDTGFNVWVLPSPSRRSTSQLPEIGGGSDDPSVIYVKPGQEANLDPLIQDTIRLATSVNETCSESCEKSEPRVYYLGEQKAPSTHRQWSRLLELRNGCQ